jgi:NADPH2:quinone reductase
MTKAIVIHKTGAPNVMKWEDVGVGKPKKGELRIRHAAVGLNFIDIYQRSGLYKIPLPSILGSEGAGVVAAVGAGVKGFKVGDRVAYAGAAGAYAEERLIPAGAVVKVPKGISDRQAAAMMLKGMTACMLLREVYKVKKGDIIVIHAAAGGVGTIMSQWARHLGATVIGTVGSNAKARLAKKNGCHHVIVLGKGNKVDFAKKVRRITKGKGVPVVYDSVGKDTWRTSIDCLAPRGVLVNFGNASGPMPPVDPMILMNNGSLYVTRPTMRDYTGTPEARQAVARQLFNVVKNGKVKIKVDQTYPLKDAARAHRDLAARKTTGSTVLLP